MAIFDGLQYGSGLYSVGLRILDEQPVSGKSLLVRKRKWVMSRYLQAEMSGLFLSTYLKLTREMLVLCVMLPGRWLLAASIRLSIVIPGAWTRKTPKKRLFRIESGTQP